MTKQRFQPEQTELLVDTHVHTHYSDGIASVARVERFCGDRGIGVAITDHNEIRGATSIYERERTPVIPAIEVGTEEGVDLLVYFSRAELLEDFYREGVEPYLRSRFMSRSWIQSIDCLRTAKEMGALRFARPPVCPGAQVAGFSAWAARAAVCRVGDRSRGCDRAAQRRRPSTGKSQGPKICGDGRQAAHGGKRLASAGDDWLQRDLLANQGEPNAGRVIRVAAVVGGLAIQG